MPAPGVVLSIGAPAIVVDTDPVCGRHSVLLSSDGAAKGHMEMELARGEPFNDELVGPDALHPAAQGLDIQARQAVLAQGLIAQPVVHQANLSCVTTCTDAVTSDSLC